MNRHLFIVRFGETALKGKNKSYFEKKLVDRVKKILRKFSGVDVYREEGLVFVSANSENSQEELVGEISKVFGISSISPAVETNPNRNHEVVGSIPDLAQWVRDLALP